MRPYSLSASLMCSDSEVWKIQKVPSDTNTKRYVLLIRKFRPDFPTNPGPDKRYVAVDGSRQWVRLWARNCVRIRWASRTRCEADSKLRASVLQAGRPQMMTSKRNKMTFPRPSVTRRDAQLRGDQSSGIFVDASTPPRGHEEHESCCGPFKPILKPQPNRSSTHKCKCNHRGQHCLFPS